MAAAPRTHVRQSQHALVASGGFRRDLSLVCLVLRSARCWGGRRADKKFADGMKDRARRK